MHAYVHIYTSISFWQGLAYTGYASVLWPAVPLVVEERIVGLAFGIVTSMLNLVPNELQ